MLKLFFDTLPEAIATTLFADSPEPSGDQVTAVVTSSNLI